jgi:intracellular septation protein A
VNSRTTHNEGLSSKLLLALCALVFFFALHAKTAVYNGGAPAKVTTATASKLWLNAQKMQVRSVDSSSSALFWMAVFCLCGLYLHREPFVQRVVLVPPSSTLTLRYMRRFLRPPPVLA